MFRRSSHKVGDLGDLGDLATTIQTNKDVLATPTKGKYSFSSQASQASQAYNAMKKRFAERVAERVAENERRKLENERKKVLEYDIKYKINKIRSVLKVVLSIPLTIDEKILLNRKLENLDIELKNITKTIPTPLPHNLTNDDEIKIYSLIEVNEPRSVSLSKNIKVERPPLIFRRTLNFPSVPTDAVVLIPTTRQLPVPANIPKERNPYNHLLMFYALFIFDFLENYYTHINKLCKLIKTSKNREIGYSKPLRPHIQKAYEELKRIYDDKQFAAGEDILKTIIGEIPVLLNTIYLILNDINIFNSIWVMMRNQQTLQIYKTGRN
jgi:hypothetical protein